MTEEELQELLGKERQDSMNILGGAVRSPTADPIADKNVYDQLQGVTAQDDYQAHLRKKLMELAARNRGM